MSDWWFWVLWCILGAILIVAEIFTSGFVLLWFGIGALLAAFARHHRHRQPRDSVFDFCGRVDRVNGGSRTIFVNYFSREKSGQSLRSGVDALPGRSALWFRRAKVRCRKAR
jgi:hypothetical protein